VYEVIVDRRVQKDFRNIPVRGLEAIEKAIDGFENNPRPFGCIKLTNQPGYRYRVGNFRILYKIDDKNKRVSVFRVKRRNERTYE